jgi:hypothetical protein
MMNLLLLLSMLGVGTADGSPEPDYSRDIKPVLRAKCYTCHGSVRQKAGLRLDAAQLIRKGGKHGPIIIAGKPDDSRLIQRVTAKGPDRMPPEGEGEPLSAKEIALFKEWIKAGANATDEPVPDDPKSHWAYQPPQKITPPADGNPVDAFLNADRAKQHLTTNPPADKAVLLRRVYLDLIGIPPTREELEAFLKDSSADAYEKVVDRLLASPKYGERWGRHWMDVWRYSDPFGLGEEYRYSQRHIWRWRDWIIDSLNHDKGYDRMIVEMLAGDEIAPADRDTLRATGYLARNWYKFNRNVWIQDTVEYSAASFLGVTLRCARCHDHKYDPISQQDYYRFRAFFEPHDIRIDLMPGQKDPNKDGVARAFDAAAVAPTYLFQRGDERLPDKSRVLSAGVPGVLGTDPPIHAVKFTLKDFATTLPDAVADARKLAQSDLASAESAQKYAADQLAFASHRLESIAAGIRPNEVEAKPILNDTFAGRNDAIWTVVRGDWAWENGKLICKTPSPFATLSAKLNLPSSMMGRVHYKTTGGGIGSVGFSFDVTGNDFQAVYINAGNDSAVRPFHRVNGQDSYPTDGIVHLPVKMNDDVTLDFAVRGNLLNTWVNGKLTCVYRLPLDRRSGAFSIWTYDAKAEFYEVRLAELPDAIGLAEKVCENRESPVGRPIVVTKEDAEKLLKRAEAAEALAKARTETAHAAITAVEARYLADQARTETPVDATKAKLLALAAGRAERGVAVLKAAEAVLAADASKLAAAKKAHADALAVAAKDDPTYTPLIKMSDPAGSTGRRLALAQWITDRKNPLTARVAVNHIWMRHFGTALVPSVANFGLNGKRPTHPELLDYLAVQFMESGWSMKKLHRLLVTSQTYRLDSRNRDGANKTADPENVQYWRANPHRMEAEVVRDSLLAVAGQLDPTKGGPILDEKLGQSSKRRSVYFRFNTEYKMQFLDQFDAASPTECYERRESVIPQQALALHNSTLAINMSRELAKQLSAHSPAQAEFIASAFEQVLSRYPDSDERKLCEKFLIEQTDLYRQPTKLTPFPGQLAGVTPPSNNAAQHAREDLIQVLFNHNDFVTVR